MSKEKTYVVAGIPTQYHIDFDKVQTIDDIKVILDSLYLIIYDNHENFDKIKHLLKDIDDE